MSVANNSEKTEIRIDFSRYISKDRENSAAAKNTGISIEDNTYRRIWENYDKYDHRYLKNKPEIGDLYKPACEYISIPK